MWLKQRHHITKIYVDGANPEVIRELKNRIGEYHDYYGRLSEEQVWSLRSSNSWQIIPVNFQKRHREMLQWMYTLMSKKFIKIHPSLQKLIVSLRTAIVSDEWKLYKQQTSYHDIVDSLRLALSNYELNTIRSRVEDCYSPSIHKITPPKRCGPIANGDSISSTYL